MSNRALRRLQGADLITTQLEPNHSDDEEEEEVVPKAKSKRKKKPAVNPFELLNDIEDEDADITNDRSDNEKEPGSNEENGEQDISAAPTKKKKKKRKKKKGKTAPEITEAPEEDEIDASIREVNALLNNGNIGEEELSSLATTATAPPTSSILRGLLTVEHKHLNPDNEMRRIFGSRVIRDEQVRRRVQGGRRRRTTWMAQPRDNWPPSGRAGLSMSLLETKDGCQYFTFVHNQQYQKVQFQFYDAVESLDPNNIGDILHQQPFHIDTLIQLSEVFRMNEDMMMSAELIERALYGQEMAFHPLFNITTGSCRLDYKRVENRCLYLALFKHIGNVGQRGCHRTALEFCKLLLSLDPDVDPLCSLLLVDYYAIRSEQYDFLVRLFDEWEAHKNLSQLPNFAYSVPLAIFHQDESNTKRADDMLQDSLLMFPGVLLLLLDKCGIQPDQAASHHFFSELPQHSQPDALKQLLTLYVGRAHSCWKPPEVVEWLERNVKELLVLVDQKDPRVEDYKKRRINRYKGTPRNIYRHILLSEIPSATTTLPPDVASTVLSYDPLPPLDTIVTYRRPERPNRAQSDGNALSMFLRSLMPNFNPNDPAPEPPVGAAGGDGNPGNQLRQGVGALMDAMRDLLTNIRMEEPPIENPQGENNPEREPEEWD